ncbi:TIGR04222 domain-containing membrane protein [Aurantiacibacter rhizosphaerae]|uniref:TIGR04222 domain-containing membrane protein n=1 Tax=Aurantiacibacter rhizosphaerae TaxID=2691582 RepID=A0A844XEU2_9SPHN|nr:TIGR04222 domain-containing membrane protein [Aurantiacibacter rhizosphaerae]MWV28269.1 TIGR04222 domain-containing membrane protein [Aurantiacibacter rhizosphaerae]
MEIGFASYSGADFLLFYAALIMAAIAAGIWIPAAMRPDGRPSQPADAEELAYLAGGTPRFVESVVAALFARRALQVEKKTIVKTTGAQGETPAEKSLMRHVGDLSWSAAKANLDGHADAIDRDLTRRGLLVDPAERLTLRLMPVLPYVFLLLLGAFRWQAGSAEGEPVGFLTTMMIITGVLAVIRLAKFNPRTRAGDAALASAMATAQRLRRATTSGEAGLAVGLFGTAVLVGTPYAPLHAMRQSAGGASTDSGDSGGDGGGGCGGGCGGCGG